MSSIDELVKLKCKGRDEKGRKTLAEAVDIAVRVRYDKEISTVISVTPTCPHLGGGHGERCEAKPRAVQIKAIICPFAFEYPHVLESDQNWTPEKHIRNVFNRALNARQPKQKKPMENRIADRMS